MKSPSKIRLLHVTQSTQLTAIGILWTFGFFFNFLNLMELSAEYLSALLVGLFYVGPFFGDLYKISTTFSNSEIINETSFDAMTTAATTTTSSTSATTLSTSDLREQQLRQWIANVTK